VRQISKYKHNRAGRAAVIKQITSGLERTAWGRGIYAATPGGRVFNVPGATPAQIRAGARKLFDVISAQVRRDMYQAAKHALDEAESKAVLG
jgi:hypothetical protein